MTSVYHLDGSDLRMTHFCAAQNQPRLKATEIDAAQGLIRFSFVDATNLKEHPAHVHGAELRFVGEDRLIIEFTVEGGARTQTEHLELARAR